MKTHWLKLLMVPLSLSLARCGESDSTNGAPIEDTQQGVHRVPDNDTSVPAVGMVRFAGGYCSGTLIGKRTVLTAAHCVYKRAQGCQTLPETTADMSFMISVNGSGNDGITYAIDDISVAPGAYFPLASCSADAANSCLTGAADNFNFGIDRGADTALLHLAVRSDQAEPSSVVSPLPVLTSLDDDSLGHGIVHARIDQQRAFGGGGQATATVVGWGNGDTQARSRRRGEMAFRQNADWASFCAESSSCAGDPSTDTCPFAPYVGMPGYHRNNEIDVFASAPSFAFTSAGDSGSPLVVIGGTGAGQVPELPGGLMVVMGTLSGGDSAPAGQIPKASGDNKGQYANLTVLETRRWLETVLALWSSPTYTPPGWASLDTWIQGGELDGAADQSFAVVRNRNHDGALELFGIGADNGLWQRTQTSSGWTGWAALPDRGWVSRVAVAAIAQGIEVFGIGGGPGHLWWQEQDAAGNWQGFHEHSTFAVRDLVAVEVDERTVTLLAIDADSSQIKVRTLSQGLFGNALRWGAWQETPDLDCTPSQLSATVASGRVELVVLCNNGLLRHSGELLSFATTPPSRRFSAWEEVSLPPSGAVSKVLAAHSSSGSLGERLVIVALDGGVVHARFRRTDAENAAFGSWLELPFGSRTNRQITAANNAEGGAGHGRLEVFATNTRKEVTHVWQVDADDDASWHAHASRGGPVTQASATFNADGRLEVFAMNGHAVVHDWQIRVPSGLSWNF